MKLQRAKGTRDFLPEEKIARQAIEDVLRQVFELYGFSPVETPALERLDVLSAKFAGGGEILKETFKLKDQGKRKIGLRYDLTVPIARVVAMNPALKLPFKRYQISKVFRDGPLKAGRYREFMQADVDILGTSSMKADAEIILVAQEVFRQLRLDVVIKVSNRKILDAILKVEGIKKDCREAVTVSLDKLEKIGLPAVEKELEKKGIRKDAVSKLLALVTATGTNKEKLRKVRESIGDNEGIKELEELLRYCPGIEVDLSLARGLAYYTGTVMEISIMNSAIKSAIAGGGRYDQLIEKLANGRQVPAVGLSFGVDVIGDVLQAWQPGKKKTTTKVFVVPIKTFPEALEVAQELRSKGIKTEIDLADRGISKNLDYADKKGIPFVVFLGERELKQKKVKLRDMESGKEAAVTMQEAIKKVQ